MPHATFHPLENSERDRMRNIVAASWAASTSKASHSQPSKYVGVLIRRIEWSAPDVQRSLVARQSNLVERVGHRRLGQRRARRFTRMIDLSVGGWWQHIGQSASAAVTSTRSEPARGRYHEAGPKCHRPGAVRYTADERHYSRRRPALVHAQTTISPARVFSLRTSAQGTSISTGRGTTPARMTD